MKVKFVEGKWDDHPEAPFLSPVAFPMVVEPATEEQEQELAEDGFFYVHDLQELKSWADMRFDSWSVYDMEFPAEAVVSWPLLHMVFLSRPDMQDPEPVGLFIYSADADRALREAKTLTGEEYGRVWHFDPEDFEDWMKGTRVERFLSMDE